MGIHTRRTEHRLLAFFMAMAVLLTFVVPSAPEVFAEEGSLPENINLTFSVSPDETEVTVSDDYKKATYDIKDKEQYVRISFNMSLNKLYEEGQLEIVIPFVGFTGREGEKYQMSSYSNFISQINSEASMLMLKEDRRYTDGTIVLTNKESTALHSGLDLEYIVYAYSVKDGAPQDFSIKVTDTHSGEDRSPAPVTATFNTSVDEVKVTKSVDETNIVNGQYPKWDPTLDEKFYLKEVYNIDEAEFNRLAQTNDFVSYIIDTTHTNNQYYNCYLKDEPLNDGEVIAVSYMQSAKNCTPLKIETEGEHAGEWKYYAGSSSRIRFVVLVKYPKGSVEPGKDITNTITVTDIGVDGNEGDEATGRDEVTSIWQEAQAIKPGDIWSVTKKAHTDPIGGLTMLRNGKDVPLSYDISGIGLTYKYSMYDGFTYPNGPYQLEIVDDAMYINGQGNNGLSGKRLGVDDFNYKSFTLKVKHDVVESVNLNNTVASSHSMPLEDRSAVSVYVMSDKSPNEWILDQVVDTRKFVSSSQSEAVYTTADDNEEIPFRPESGNVYRVKFVYPNANGDVEVKATLNGVIKADSPAIKQTIDNIDSLNIANFQVFNWDGAMGFDKDHVWLNPNDASDIKTDLPGMKEDLIELDAALYEGHINDETTGNIQLTKRIPAQNDLKETEVFAGAAKDSASVTYNTEEGRAELTYTMGAIYGGAPLKSNFDELMELGILEAPKKIVFYDLLPEGVYYKGYDFNRNEGNYFYSNDHYNWKRISGQYSDIVKGCKLPDSVDVDTTDNYKGTRRQLVKLTLNYSEPPICKVGYNLHPYEEYYCFGTGIYLKAVAEYSDLRSSTLINNMTAQFVNDKDKPIEIKDTAVHSDDGSIYESIKDRDGGNAFSDIDNDKDTSSQNIVGASSTNTISIIYSATQLKKWIKADDFDSNYKIYTQTYAGHNYRYKIQFFSNKGRSKNIVLFDSIEEAYKESKYDGLDHWKGTLYGVDLQEAKDQGFDHIKVYVNTSKFYTYDEISTNYSTGFAGLTPDDLTAANGWQEIDPDTYENWSDVKTIAFAIGEDVEFGEDDDLPSNISVYLKMKAPEGVPEGQTKTTQVLAYNSPAYYSEKASTGDTWNKDTTIANVVTIGVKSAQADIPAIKKVMEGSALPEGFKDTVEFTITPQGDTPAPRTLSGGTWGSEIKSVKMDVTTGASSPTSTENGSMFFTEPTKVYDEIGNSILNNEPYTYIIKETAGSKAGVKYSKAQYRVEYEVSDTRLNVQYADDTELTVKQTIYKTVDDDGTVLSAPLEVSEIQFNNDYTPAPAEVEIPAVSKKITGADRPEEKEFTFALMPYLGTAAMPAPEKTTVTIKGEGSASFGKVNFTAEGTYTYGIYEVAGTETGYTYDKDKAFAAVFYVKDHDGELKVDKTELFSYKLKDGEIDPDTKAEAEKFEFTNDYTPNPSNAVTVPSVAKDYSGEPRPADKEFTFVISPVGDDSIPMPAKNEVTVKGLGSATFEGEMIYTSAGTYVYEITEKDIDPSIKGYIKDESVYTYTVTVIDNDGTLEASGSMTKDGEDVSAVIFKNAYRPVETTLEVPAPEKKIEGEVPEGYTKEFSFTIKTGTDGAPMPENTKATVKGEGTASAFGNITFTKAGTYTYTVSEDDLSDAHKGYTKDDSVYDYTVTVTDNDGELKASAEITKDSKVADKFTFTNTYAPKETSVIVPIAVKEVEGKEYDETTSDAETFTFEITADEDIPMPENTKASVNGEGTATPFGSIVFKKAGTYEYKISENELDKSVHGFTVDSSVYTFTVTVKDNDGELVAETALTKDGTAADEPVFTNVYKAEPCEAPIEVEKKITGTAPASAETYTFTLTADGKDEKATVNGAGKASFEKRVYTEEGVYTYTIKEVKGSDTHCTYDTAVYTVTDTVTDSKGVLVYDRKITSGGSEKSAIVFTNNYVEESRPDSSSDSSEESSSGTDLTSMVNSMSSDVDTDSETSSDSSSETSSVVSSSTTSSETSSTGTGTGTNENPKTGLTAAIGINAILIPVLIFVSRKRRNAQEED